MGNIGWYRDKLPTRDQYRYKTAQPCTTYNWIGSLRLQFVRSVFYFQLGIPQTAVLLTRDEYSLLHLPIFCSSNCSINPYHPQKIAILYISIPIYPFPQVFIGFHILPPQSFLGFCRVVRGCSFSLFLRKNCDTEPFPIVWPFLLLKGVPWSRHAIILHLYCRANHWMPRQKKKLTPHSPPEEVTDWLLSWLARCFNFRPVCREKGSDEALPRAPAELGILFFFKKFLALPSGKLT